MADRLRRSQSAAARPATHPTTDAADRVDLLLFTVADARLALPLDTIDEVIRAATTTRLPRAPDIIEGVLDVRGRVLPVFDLRRRLHWAAKPMAPSDHLILARAGTRRVILRVDATIGLATVASSDIEEAAALGAAAPVAGIVRLPDGLAIVHDLDLFLSAAEDAALTAAEAAAAAAIPAFGPSS